MPDAAGFTVDDAELPGPDIAVLRLNRRPPPPVPLAVLGPEWNSWVLDAAKAASCPPDYVLAPLLATASVLIGNARWAQATSGWAEPPHLWCAVVGDSGSSKSPASDTLMRHVLPTIERRITVGFPKLLRQWQAQQEANEAAVEAWKKDVRSAHRSGNAPPLPPAGIDDPEPQAPRVRQADVTIEKVAVLLARVAPKGLLIQRDEVAGWLLTMNSYNEGGRAFWIESYGGRPYRVERVKHPQPIDVPHLAVAVTGGTQPDKLRELMREADDGLLARFCWFWPDPVPSDLSRTAPAVEWATEALDRLRRLEMAPSAEPGAPATPRMVPLAQDAREAMVEFGRDMQASQQEAGGLLCSAFGKARGTALRLSLVLEHLWWCAGGGTTPPPTVISRPAFLAAAHLVADYLMPMAERVFGDAGIRAVDRNATTLARWIVKERAQEVHVRHLQREVRLPGLGDADAIHSAAQVLVEAAWLYPPEGGGFQARARQAYRVNPLLWSAVP